ncbi:hypothetical protein D5F01_LYC15076 [Larimichthys crocea]|uniref:MABP domain-containing protein n=1 Tax=Larimichthys crocea TaxID=215358 RepID=A0A6G0I7B1_LARCR|nr:hypothetical protein D5F01_LYC15076 [Larimichthys crocea]
MAEYITHLDVSIDEAEEKNLQSQGFKKINVDLNKGAGGNYIYLWYKTEQGSAPITRLQVTFSDDMAVGLISAGYTKIDKDLNAGAGGDYIYLWYFKGSTEYDTPIVELDVTADAQSEGLKFKNDWERLACDLNRKAKGNWIHIWMKREKQTYICDITATDSFGLDADYFQQGAGGNDIYLWYKTEQDSALITRLQVTFWHGMAEGLKDVMGCNSHVIPPMAVGLINAGYRKIDKNLNAGAAGDQIYLCYFKRSTEYDTPIVKIHVTTNAQDEASKFKDHWERLACDLNRNAGGNWIHISG